ncbi:hypothetical protein BDV25DRAFT_149253 [Aspergillus avenaceus]|uniref:Uncharacterized protein n=1 Tax=Aspergillus avenaceus TaxID=36643 RepID=A0A5N6U4J8_ASPAV|nr:hypothetical protein BDV25DRAFT_149253 [Aspergillus avenaceus]
MMNIVVAPIRPSMVTYTVQAKRTTEIYFIPSLCPPCNCVTCANFMKNLRFSSGRNFFERENNKKWEKDKK